MNYRKKFDDFVDKQKEYYNWDEKPKPRYYIPKKKDSNLWEIRKRSLPPGIDQIVMDGLKQPMASNLWQKRFKAKKQENGNWIYYDLVREDGTKAGIYDNDLPKLTKENPEPLQILLDDVKYND